jgi:hypothetical protein
MLINNNVLYAVMHHIAAGDLACAGGTQGNQHLHL